MNDINLRIPRAVGMLRATIEYLERELSILEDPNRLTPEEVNLFNDLEKVTTKPAGGMFNPPVVEPETPSPSVMFGNGDNGPVVVVGDEKIPLDTPAPPIETTAAPAIELDSTGIPWDGRINVPKKTIRKSDNTWTLKRNVDPLIVDQVRGELRDLMAGVDISKNTGEKKATDILTPPPPETAVDAVEAFPAFLNKVTPRLTSPQGAEFKTKMDAILHKHGIAQAGLLMTAPELIPTIDALLEIEWTKLTNTQA